jgi:hypothetical protein
MAGLLAAQGQDVEFFAVAASPDEPLVVIHIDEIDLWGRNREDFRHKTARERLLGAAAAIDGIDDTSRNKVLWLASSNHHRGQLDPALVRAGRYGFSVHIDTPSVDERAQILAYYAATRRVAPDIDWMRAAALAAPAQPRPTCARAGRSWRSADRHARPDPPRELRGVLRPEGCGRTRLRMGIPAGRDQVARVMQAVGLQTQAYRRGRPASRTDSGPMPSWRATWVTAP